MKVLFLASKKFDYGQDLLHRGLVQLLGQASVRATPFKPVYYFSVKNYPKNLGRSAENSLAGYLRSLSIGPANANLVVVGAAKPDVFRHYLDIVRDIPDSTPIAFIDGGDAEELGGDLVRLKAGHLWREVQKRRPFDFIFKREYLKGREYASHILPLPFSMDPTALQTKPFPKPDKDVSFWAVESHPIRSQALDVLTGKFDCDQNGTGRNKKFDTYKYKGKRYHEELAKCKIVLSMRGGGWDTLRYWEVPALGPLMVTHKLGIVIPNDFEPGKHIALVNDHLSDLIDVCKHYLLNEDKRLAMAHAAYDHLLKFHTPLHRARSVIDAVTN